MSETLYLKQMELGPMQNFVYLIGDPETRECVVVDPAWEIDAIVEQVEPDGMRLSGVLVTHTHQDHVGGHLFGYDIPGVEELLGRSPARSTCTRPSANSSGASAPTSSRSTAATRSTWGG